MTHASLKDPQILARLVSRARQGIYLRSADGRLLDANAAMLRLLGVRSVAELAESRWSELASAGDGGLVTPDDAESIDGPEVELVLRGRDGSSHTVLDAPFDLVDEQTGEVLVHGIVVDVTERKRLVEQLRELSVRDPLTGCFNRRRLEELERRLSDGGYIWGAIVIDIDGFKLYNDRFGHQAGDDVLVRVSRFLNQCVRSEDTVVRLGGDEFAIIVAGTIEAATEIVTARIKARAPIAAPVPFTLGNAVRRGSETLAATIDRADQRLIQVRIADRGEDRRSSYVSLTAGKQPGEPTSAVRTARWVRQSG